MVLLIEVSYKGALSLQIKGVLFDLDGTLVNTSELIIKTFEQTIMTHLGKNPSQDEITRYFGLPLKECLRKFDEEKADDMMAFYREYNTKHHDLLIKPFPRISEALSMLRRMESKWLWLPPRSCQWPKEAWPALILENSSPVS
jgi:pyrophosphatase PpaX